MRHHQFLAGFVAALVLAVPAGSFAQTNAEVQSQIIALLQQVVALLTQISELQAATAPTPQTTLLTPATPPGVSTAGCIPMTGAQTTSGRNSCGDLYCPDKPPAHRYWCRAGKNPAAWYSSTLPCTGLSCMI